MKILCLLLGLLFTSNAVLAQNSTPQTKEITYGFQLGQFQRDFALGINLTSPYVFNSAVAVRMRGNLAWHEHLTLNESTEWTPYYNSMIGLIGRSSYSENIRLYGEGGLVMFFPGSLSSSQFNLGGYGLFGFEFATSAQSNYFIEIGGMGNGSVADKLPNNPIYSNGMIINVGFRISL